jgi:acylphosphatase
MLVARRFRVTGRVQGVGYRYFAQAAARAEGLSGWAQNQADGSVEVVAEGDQESVRRFEAKLRRGPAGARVDDVRVDEAVPSGRSSGFVVTSAYGRDE